MGRGDEALSRPFAEQEPVSPSTNRTGHLQFRSSGVPQNPHGRVNSGGGSNELRFRPTVPPGVLGARRIAESLGVGRPQSSDEPRARPPGDFGVHACARLYHVIANFCRRASSPRRSGQRRAPASRPGQRTLQLNFTFSFVVGTQQNSSRLRQNAKLTNEYEETAHVIRSPAEIPLKLRDLHYMSERNVRNSLAKGAHIDVISLSLQQRKKLVSKERWAIYNCVGDMKRGRGARTTRISLISLVCELETQEDINPYNRTPLPFQPTHVLTSTRLLRGSRWNPAAPFCCSARLPTYYNFKFSDPTDILFNGGRRKLGAEEEEGRFITTVTATWEGLGARIDKKNPCRTKEEDFRKPTSKFITLKMRRLNTAPLFTVLKKMGKAFFNGTSWRRRQGEEKAYNRRGHRHFTSLGRYSLSAGVDRLLVRNLGHPVGYQLVCGGEEKLTPAPLRTHQTYFKLQSNIIVQDSQGSAWELGGVNRGGKREGSRIVHRASHRTRKKPKETSTATSASGARERRYLYWRRPAAPTLADQQARPADVRRGARQTHPRRSEGKPSQTANISSTSYGAVGLTSVRCAGIAVTTGAVLNIRKACIRYGLEPPLADIQTAMRQGIPSYNWRAVPWGTYHHASCSYTLHRSGALTAEPNDVALAERLDCTKAKWVQSPAGLLPDFRKWESCRAMPLVGGFFSGIFCFRALDFQRCSILASFHPHRLSRLRCQKAAQILQLSY
ncbi:hypothetical protein PR048_016187 [Dryococelus australis]|uniref:Ribosomal protein S3 n=1 Tax=Dryococelus australis TaxID=614101 RepID=A0ABQ9HJ69_9NEOP|nr:hypothetical protein PR048_016187 [Dryococelus australis]